MSAETELSSLHLVPIAFPSMANRFIALSEGLSFVFIGIGAVSGLEAVARVISGIWRLVSISREGISFDMMEIARQLSAAASLVGKIRHGLWTDHVHQEK
jgi:hypothetical protein